ncbi:hypothetical protein VP01_2251g1 [Puccinia sorghi]|uniref:Uncharacterized protein n=1 Tax=Puccinia sorghi TaxID=27349 RepID=A0A0L6V8M3_9BASI|nr:hypothetical protein VP01_2251g1 [Puccinia sorghi]
MASSLAAEDLLRMWHSRTELSSNPICLHQYWLGFGLKSNKVTLILISLIILQEKAIQINFSRKFILKKITNRPLATSKSLIIWSIIHLSKISFLHIKFTASFVIFSLVCFLFLLMSFLLVLSNHLLFSSLVLFSSNQLVNLIHLINHCKKNLLNCLQLKCSMLQPSCHPSCTFCAVTVHQSLVESLLENGWSNNRSFLVNVASLSSPLAHRTISNLASQPVKLSMWKEAVEEGIKKWPNQVSIREIQKPQIIKRPQYTYSNYNKNLQTYFINNYLLNKFPPAFCEDHQPLQYADLQPPKPTFHKQSVLPVRSDNQTINTARTPSIYLATFSNVAHCLGRGQDSFMGVLSDSWKGVETKQENLHRRLIFMFQANLQTFIGTSTEKHRISHSQDDSRDKRMAQGNNYQGQDESQPNQQFYLIIDSTEHPMHVACYSTDRKEKLMVVVIVDSLSNNSSPLAITDSLKRQTEDQNRHLNIFPHLYIQSIILPLSLFSPLIKGH